MSSSIQHVEPVNQTTILGWMDEVRAAVKTAPWADLVDFDGIDALDVLLSPLYLSVLNAVRDESTERRPAVQVLMSRARNLAYRAKMAFRERVAAQGSAAPGPADVVLWSRDITHNVIFQPVAQAVRDMGVSCRPMSCQAGVFKDLREGDRNSVYTRGAWPEAVRAARRAGARRASRLAAVGPWTIPSFPNASAINVEPLVRNTIIRMLPLASEAVVNARMALESFGAKLLVVGNDLTLEGRAGCRVAAQAGVPSAVFMHGSIAGDALHSLHCADRVLVCGRIHRRELVQQGVSPERIVVCGAPNLDNRPRQTGNTHPLLESRLGLGARDPWILVATSGPGHRISHRQHQIIIEQLARLSTALPNVPVVVKLHRKDRLKYYQEVLQHAGRRKMFVVAVDTHGFPRDIFEWLEGCRVVLTGASAVAVEAMLMDVPVVTMDFCDEVHGVDFIDAGATTHVCTAEALVDAVREILAAGGSRPTVESRVRAYLKEAFCALDGQSAMRGARSLVELIERRGAP
jgi:hypothetical protein